jgi:hypothetical protein
MGKTQILDSHLEEEAMRRIIEPIMRHPGVRNVFRELIRDAGDVALEAVLWSKLREVTERKLQDCQNRERTGRLLPAV